MKIILAGRGEGKTTELIHLSAEKWYYIVCEAVEDVARIAGEASDRGLQIPFPLTYNEFLNHQYLGGGIKGILVDNVDKLLQYISRGKVKGFSVDATDSDLMLTRSQLLKAELLDARSHVQVYTTSAALGYIQVAYLVRIAKSKNGYDYLCVDTHNISRDNDMYVVGKEVEDLEDSCVKLCSKLLEDCAVVTESPLLYKLLFNGRNSTNSSFE
jgi:hypothetical protein